MSEELDNDTAPTPGPHGDTGAGTDGGDRGLGRLRPAWRSALSGALLAALVVCGGLVAGYLLVEIPAPNSAAAAQNNVYLYSDGSVLARDGEVNRQKVQLDDIPASTRHAVLAAEDRDFYHQPAVDPLAMLRAGWNMLQGEGRQSGSTITQQYVKNYYLNQEQTLTRKTKEFFIALKLDREVSKDEILAGYLNTSYFGRNSYGIQAAAQAYYGKDVGALTTAEGAYLAALLNSPSAYDVGVHPENRDRAVARWRYVLDGMVGEGWLEPSERDAMEFPETLPVKPPNSLSGQRGYLVEAVKDHIVGNGILSEQRLAQGGFRITTTIDPDKQDALLRAVEDELLSRLDEDREVDSYVRAGGTSIDPRTGEVVAMYGGIDYTRQFINNATRRDYQPGSTFKPFVYAAALTHGATTLDGRTIGPGTAYDGTSGRTVMGPGGPTDWAPENEDEADYGRIPVSTAMAKSVNAVFAQMGVDVGPDTVRRTAVRLGIPESVPGMKEADASIALGTPTASTFDLARAYATLANHGRHGTYTLVEEITRGEERIELPERRTEQAVPREAADATTAVLRGVVEDGTGVAAGAGLAGRPAAGKTGTAEEDQAAWFAGYTPELATVIAVMGQDPETGAHKPLYGAAGLPRVNGGGFPAQIWSAYTAEALRGTPVRDFDLRLGRTGQLPTGAPSATASPEAGASVSPETSPETSPEASPEPSGYGSTDDARPPDSAPAAPWTSPAPEEPAPGTGGDGGWEDWSGGDEGGRPESGPGRGPDGGGDGGPPPEDGKGRGPEEHWEHGGPPRDPGGPQGYGDWSGTAPGTGGHA